MISLNNLTSVKDPRGFTTTYTYEGKLLKSSIDALQGETTYSYTSEGFLELVTDLSGRVTSYTYNDYGQRLSMKDPDENTWHYTYDVLGRLTDTQDPRGRVTHNEYNAAGKLIRVTQNYDPDRSKNEENQYNIVTEYDYDVRGNQIAVTDTYGHTTRYVYDDADRLLKTVDSLGNATVNAYDAAGQLISTTDPLGNKTTYKYDATGRLIKTINALGLNSNVTSFDVSANTSTVTDILGRSTVFYYDELGRVIKVVDPLSKSVLTTYDENGNVKTRTDQLGRPTQYEYDELNHLVKTIDPNGGETETFYDTAGNRIATEDPLDHRTSYIYESGRLVATTDPLQRITQTEYDDYGRRIASIDAAGHRTAFTYDALDRVIAVTDDDDNSTHTTYDALGNVISRTDANGHTTQTTYDELNRPLIITDANGNETINAYDEGGNLVSVTDGLEHTTHYTYDKLNRQITVTDPLEHTTWSYYDKLGNLYEKVDANGVVTHYIYDELNRQKAVVLNYKDPSPANAETNVRYEFTYNAVGNRIAVKDPKGNTTTYGYDALNHVISKSDPLENNWSYIYDLAGNRISATDAKDQTTQYTYDDAGQLIGIDYPGTDPDVTFEYDENGQRIEMNDGLGKTTWTYDDLNRLISVTDAFSKTIGYGYDDVGNRTELRYQDGKSVAYTYDDNNQLIKVTDWDEQNTEYSYDDAGRLSTISRPNGVSSQYTYDEAGRLVALYHNLGMESLASYNYTYDPAGNRTQAIELLKNPQQLASLMPESQPVSQNAAKVSDLPASNKFTSFNVSPPQKAPYNPKPQQLDFNRLPLSFILNVGQWDKAVNFQTNSLGGSIFFTPSEVVLALMDKKIKLKSQEDDLFASADDTSKVVRIEYKNAKKDALIEGSDLQPGVANFMVGSDKKAWVANAPMYGGIVYRDLYPGVDLSYEGAGRSLKSTFTVAPGVDVSLIRWRYKDAGEISLDADGNLLIALSAQKAAQTDITLVEHTPIAWQEVNGQRVDVAVQYAIAQNGDINFVLPQGYDSTLPLTIDPVLTYSTYLGDIGTDVGTAITTDLAGNVYATGYSWCGDFPITTSIPGIPSGSSEAIISKISANGSTLLYSTCVGGSGADEGWSITLDTQGRIVVAGETESNGFSDCWRKSVLMEALAVFAQSMLPARITSS